MQESQALHVRPAHDDEREEIAARLRRSFGATRMVSRGRLWDASDYPALVVERDGRIAGHVTYATRGDECELTTIEAEGGGAGTALLNAVIEQARRHGCRRLWLITSNDNLPALRFYQRRGLRLAALHRDAVTEARALKPEIPDTGHAGIPIRDEIELELLLDER